MDKDTLQVAGAIAGVTAVICAVTGAIVYRKEIKEAVQGVFSGSDDDDETTPAATADSAEAT